MVSSPCRGISLPTNSAWNGASRLRAGPKEPILGADEAHLDPVVREPELLTEEPGVSLGVRDDDIGSTEGPPVDEVHDPCAG